MKEGDKIVNIECNYPAVRYWMPFDIPVGLDTLENAKALAREWYGWKDQIPHEVEVVNEEDGTTTTEIEMIDNPQSPFEAIAEAFRVQLKMNQRTLAIRQGQEMAAEHIANNFDAIFNQN